MKQIALDTNAYSAFKCGDRDIIEIIANADTINISSIVVGELLAVFSMGSNEKINRKELDSFLNAERCQVISVDQHTPIYYAHIYKMLLHKGKPIPANDLWIAAVTLQHGHILCTLDKHFSHIDNLMVCTQLSHILP